MAELPLPQPLPARGRGVASTFAPGDFGLYAGTVLIWSTTWLALKFQLGVVDPQVSIVWRFLIAAPLMFLVCWLAGARIRFPLRMHLRFAALGLFLYSTNFILFYNAGHFVVSGLIAVIFSLASITNIALAALFLGEPLRPRVALGAAARARRHRADVLARDRTRGARRSARSSASGSACSAASPSRPAT